MHGKELNFFIWLWDKLEKLTLARQPRIGLPEVTLQYYYTIIFTN